MALLMVLTGLLLAFLEPDDTQKSKSNQSAEAGCAPQSSGTTGASDNGNQGSNDHCQAEPQADKDTDESGGGPFNLARIWASYVAAATLAIAAIAGVFAVRAVSATRLTARSRLAIRLAPGTEPGLRFEVRNLGPTVALLHCLWIEGVCEAVEEGVEDALDKGGTLFMRTLGPGESAIFLEKERPSSQHLLVAAEFKDVFGVPRRAWRFFSRDEEGTSYEPGDDGELAGPWWAD